MSAPVADYDSTLVHESDLLEGVVAILGDEVGAWPQDADQDFHQAISAKLFLVTERLRQMHKTFEALAEEMEAERIRGAAEARVASAGS